MCDFVKNYVMENVKYLIIYLSLINFFALLKKLKDAKIGNIHIVENKEISSQNTADSSIFSSPQFNKLDKLNIGLVIPKIFKHIETLRNGTVECRLYFSILKNWNVCEIMHNMNNYAILLQSNKLDKSANFSASENKIIINFSNCGAVKRQTFLAVIDNKTCEIDRIVYNDKNTIIVFNIAGLYLFFNFENNFKYEFVDLSGVESIKVINKLSLALGFYKVKSCDKKVEVNCSKFNRYLVQFSNNLKCCIKYNYGTKFEISLCFLKKCENSNNINNLVKHNVFGSNIIDNVNNIYEQSSNALNNDNRQVDIGSNAENEIDYNLYNLTEGIYDFIISKYFKYNCDFKFSSKYYKKFSLKEMIVICKEKCEKNDVSLRDIYSVLQVIKDFDKQILLKYYYKKCNLHYFVFYYIYLFLGCFVKENHLIVLKDGIIKKCSIRVSGRVFYVNRRGEDLIVKCQNKVFKNVCAFKIYE